MSVDNPKNSLCVLRLCPSKSVAGELFFVSDADTLFAKKIATARAKNMFVI